MTPVKPDLPHFGARIVMNPIPASVDDGGLMMTEWELSEEEKLCLYAGGIVRIWIDHKDRMQPIVAEVASPIRYTEYES